MIRRRHDPHEEITDIYISVMPSEITVYRQSGDVIPNRRDNAEDQQMNPVNFDELKTNHEIIGWIYMTTPYISQPVLMHKKDDDYYLSRMLQASTDRDGSFYIQRNYNNPDFDDPVTIIYGHRRRRFHVRKSSEHLKKDIDINADPQYVVIYLPNSTKIYHIIATIRHDSTHICIIMTLVEKSVFDEFFDKVYKQTGTGYNW